MHIYIYVHILVPVQQYNPQPIINQPVLNAATPQMVG